MMSMMATQEKILAQNVELNERLLNVEEMGGSGAMSRSSRGGYANRGASTRAKNNAARRGLGHQLETLPDDSEEVEDLKNPATTLSKPAQQAKKILQVSS
jgi:hypothetical protein